MNIYLEIREKNCNVTFLKNEVLQIFFARKCSTKISFESMTPEFICTQKYLWVTFTHKCYLKSLEALLDGKDYFWCRFYFSLSSQTNLIDIANRFTCRKFKRCFCGAVVRKKSDALHFSRKLRCIITLGASYMYIHETIILQPQYHLIFIHFPLICQYI